MPAILKLQELLQECDVSGITPSALSYCIDTFLKSNADDTPENFNIELDASNILSFLIHQSNNKKILTLKECLMTGTSYGIALDTLPEIFSKLDATDIKFDALQFPHGFMVEGRFSGTSYRAHFNFIVFYKDSNDRLNIQIIDSTNNPIGIINPISTLFSTSIFSGKELLYNKFRRFFSEKENMVYLFSLFQLPKDRHFIQFPYPILTGVQPSLGDKRCSAYVLNAMTYVINMVTSREPITPEGLVAEVTLAHNELKGACSRLTSKS